MASPKDGSFISADAPAGPAAPTEAISTDPGELSKIVERNREIENAKIDSVTVDPLNPPPSGGGSDNPPTLAKISVELQDPDGKPVVGEPYFIIFSDNSRQDGVTKDDGKDKMEGEPAGAVKINFYKIDNREWKAK